MYEFIMTIVETQTVYADLHFSFTQKCLQLCGLVNWSFWASLVSSLWNFNDHLRQRQTFQYPNSNLKKDSARGIKMTQR